ncbi:hypothetical protein Droror1_Dr00015515 [Drosera rotundifolia]
MATSVTGDRDSSSSTPSSPHRPTHKIVSAPGSVRGSNAPLEAMVEPRSEIGLVRDESNQAVGSEPLSFEPSSAELRNIDGWTSYTGISAVMKQRDEAKKELEEAKALIAQLKEKDQKVNPYRARRHEVIGPSDPNPKPRVMNPGLTRFVRLGTSYVFLCNRPLAIGYHSDQASLSDGIEVVPNSLPD